MLGVTPFIVRIRAQGELVPADRQELPGLLVSAAGDELVLSGAVADQAALLGVLARLHHAEVRVHDVERVPESHPGGGARGAQESPPPGAFLARIQLTGRVADYLAGVQGAEAVTESPASTTIEVQLAEEQELQGVLTMLESLALQVIEVHVRPAGKAGESATMA